MLKVDDRGVGNRIEMSDTARATLNGTVVLRGNNNLVRIGDDCTSNANLRFELGSDSSVRLGGRNVLNDMFVYADRRAHLTVGTDSGFNGATRFLMHEPGRIDIGHGALFAGQIDVTISDMHSIIDLGSSVRINPPADISIGNRVWLGERCMVLKGTRIGDGSVVGAMSLVHGQLPGNSICAGVPARILRSGATWRHDLIAWGNQTGSTDPGVGGDRAPTEPLAVPRRAVRRSRVVGRRIRSAFGVLFRG